ncbi:MAG TPA: phosphatidate cytidylyltransferase [Thermoanaerobaculia bacterium]|jgi:phosphatidate cytidylyltransferase|nr:phosphatidate cytidylyltransferase [Thermoanaerobaculia bacterium]
MKRFLTAAVLAPLALLALFYLPGPAFFALLVILLDGAAYEFIAIVRPQAPRAPLKALLVLIPLAALAVSWSLTGSPGAEPRLHLLAAGLFFAVGLGTLVLLSRTPLDEVLPALGILGFGTAYFALPISSLHYLQQVDPWLVFLLLAIVWLGDTAAYYVGSRIGRHKMAPVVSPKKSWEGSIASLLTAVGAAAAWSAWRLGHLDGAILALAAVVSIAAQVGDLVESLIKRGSGVKDSGHILPGHGGILDRMDAMLFAAPVLLIGLWVLRHSSFVR